MEYCWASKMTTGFIIVAPFKGVKVGTLKRTTTSPRRVPPLVTTMKTGAISRREVVRTALSIAVLSTLFPHSEASCAPAAPTLAPAPFELPPLPYEFNALEPAIDEQTMRLHHGKHFAGYTKNLNAALSDLNLTNVKNDADLGKLLGNLTSIKDEKLRKTVRNNGGGYVNHKLFFATMRAPSKAEPSGPVVDAIVKEWGSFETFKTEFSKAASSVFGSGWVFLVKKGTKLSIASYPNQDNPLMDDSSCELLMGLDVWEHAYYLLYNNRRSDYINAFYSVIDYSAVSDRFLGKTK